MYGRNTANPQPAFQTQIEIRCIDPDEHRRWIGKQLLVQSPPDTQQFRQMTQDLHQAHHRQPFQGHQATQSLLDHAGSADAAEAGMRVMRPQDGDEVGTQQIARQLAGYQRDVHERTRS